jgi:hypothetical protein
MRLPGFTAEDSLPRTRASYKLPNGHTGLAVNGIVVPQLFTCHGNFCCDEWGYCIYKGHVLM